jgi:hypothetical protein
MHFDCGSSERLRDPTLKPRVRLALEKELRPQRRAVLRQEKKNP